MNKVTTVTTNRRRQILALALVLLLAGCMIYAAPMAFAAPTEKAVWSGVITIIQRICLIVGAIFAVVGIVKVAIAHANEDGPATQKAAMMIASGLVLVVLGAGLINTIAGAWF